MLEGFPLQQFHCNKMKRRCRWIRILTILIQWNSRSDVMDRANVRMIECGSCARFTLEALQCIGIVCKFLRQEFQRDAAAEASVFGAIHDAHSAAAKQLQNSIMRNSLPDHVTLNFNTSCVWCSSK